MSTKIQTDLDDYYITYITMLEKTGVLLVLLLIAIGKSQTQEQSPNIISPGFADLFRKAIANQTELELMGLINNNDFENNEIDKKVPFYSIIRSNIVESRPDAVEVDSSSPPPQANSDEVKYITNSEETIEDKDTSTPAKRMGIEEMTKGDSETTNGDSGTLKGDSGMTKGDTEITKGDSEMTKGDTETIKGDSEMTIGDSEMNGDKDMDVVDNVNTLTEDIQDDMKIPNGDTEEETTATPVVTVLETYNIDLKNDENTELKLDVKIFSNSSIKLGCHLRSTRALFEHGNPIIYASLTPCSSLTSQDTVQAIKIVELKQEVEDDEELYSRVELEDLLTNGCVFVIVPKGQETTKLDDLSLDTPAQTSNTDNLETQNSDDMMKDDDNNSSVESISVSGKRRKRMIFFHQTLQRLSQITLNLNNFNILGFGSKPVIAAAPVVSSFVSRPSFNHIPFIPSQIVATPFDPFGTFPNIQIPGIDGNQIFGVAVIIVLFYILYFATSLFSGGIFGGFAQKRYDYIGTKEWINGLTNTIYTALRKHKTNYGQRKYNHHYQNY
ncbi:unnamed protein product [Lepeophtheirus salmonis]|uniref:(salmon louse) hypothetical protein n=1 Tax=Lepeophtheirus salmonis TaxID=72036 RepID=A0A7R8CVS8_LEPSM|nr:unnamed protein product [Lepeophtheirus salmonis]CAF2915264.1 unnamed protein product [Lepeophtheirus salmonis]